MTSRFNMLVGIAVAVLAVAVVTLGYLRSRMQPRFPYMTNPLSDADYAAMAAKPGWRAQRLSVAPGVALRGLLREPATPAGPWILFFSGNSPHLLAESQQVIDAICAERGWGGVVWAYRGFDSSGGAPDPQALAADGFKSYLQLLSEHHIKPDAVHVVGYSLGTSIATAVVAQAYQDPPASLTLLAPMTTLYIGARSQLRLHRYETTRWLGKVASPTLVIHGRLDGTLSVENGRAVAQALGSRASLLELPELGHLELPMSPAAQQAMHAFISRHAAASTSSLVAP